MFSKLFNWFKSKEPQQTTFPNQVYRFWYCYKWRNWRTNLMSAGAPSDSEKIAPFGVGQLAFNPFTTGLCGDDESGLINGLIPGMCVGNWVAMYECSRPYAYGSRSDLAGWDDGLCVDLTFKYTLPLNTVIDHLGLTGRYLTLIDNELRVVSQHVLGSIDQQPGD